MAAPEPAARPHEGFALEDYYRARERLARSRARLEPLDPVMRALLDAAERFLERRRNEQLED